MPHNKLMNTNQLISLLVIIAGLGLSAAGIGAYFRRKAMLRRAVHAEGVVTDVLPIRKEGAYVVNRERGGLKVEPKYSYRAVVRFETSNGRQFEVRANVSTRPAGWKPGERVDVIYDPDRPESARINQPVYLWFEVSMLVFFGLFFIGMGLLGIWLQS